MKDAENAIQNTIHTLGAIAWLLMWNVSILSLVDVDIYCSYKFIYLCL